MRILIIALALLLSAMPMVGAYGWPVAHGIPPTGVAQPLVEIVMRVDQPLPSPADTLAPHKPDDHRTLGFAVLIILLVLTAKTFYRRGARREIVVPVDPRSDGVFAGLFGCVFGVLGVLTIGIIFVPLAALCSIVGVVRALSVGSVKGTFVSLIAMSLTVVGFVVSPTLWLLFGLGAMMLAVHS